MSGSVICKQLLPVGTVRLTVLSLCAFIVTSRSQRKYESSINLLILHSAREFVEAYCIQLSSFHCYL